MYMQRTIGIIAGVFFCAHAAAAERPARKAALDRFLADNPGVRSYDFGNNVVRLYGRPFAGGPTPQAVADAFVRRNSALFGVRPDELLATGTQSVMRDKFTAVYYRQTHHGVPVHRAWVTVLTRADLNHGVALVSAELFDFSDVTIAPVVISGAEAVAALARLHPDFTFTEPELVVFRGNIDEDEGWDVIYGYRLSGQNDFNPAVDNGNLAPESYEFIVDATRPDAPVVSQESRIYFVDVFGQVTGKGTPGELPDRVDNPPVILPMEDLRVRIVGGNTGQTDSAGNYVIANPGSTSVTVQTSVGGSGSTQAGQWVRVDDVTGGEQTLSQSVTPPGPADFLFNVSPVELETAEINGFIRTTDVHNFVKAINPAYPGVDVQMPCFVNRTDGFCPGNAWYNFSVDINFCRAGSGFPNTAFSSVVYHEYGHHIIASGHPGATGDFHEGVADVTASLLMDTDCLGRGFTGGNACLRSAYNSVNYPCSGEAHTCGQVISGAYWLTRDELLITEPADYLTIIRDLYLNMILLQPAGITPAITIDVLTLDDDNGDIADGTPHYQEIATGFGAKNLDAPPLEPLRFIYPAGQPTHIAPDAEHRLRVEVQPLTADPQPGTGKLFYDIGAGFVMGTMETVSPNVYDAVLPAVPCGTPINYYITAQTTGATTATSPSGAPASSFAAFSAFDLVIAMDDMYETDLGWTPGVPGDTATTGIWTRVNPNGTAAQPEDDHTPDPGVMCYVTGQGTPGGGLGENDVDNGRTTLLSPVFDLSSGDARISYWRWYSNNTGAAPNADVFEVDITNNNGASWVNVETVGPAGAETGGGWFYHEFIVSQFVAPTDQVRVRFVASDLGSGSLVEAAVDDFQLVVTDCTFIPQSGNLNCDGQVNAADVPAFVLALIDPDGYANAFPDCDITLADMNGDGLENGDDIDEFVALVLAGI